MGFDFSNASDANLNPIGYFSDRSEDYEKYRPIHPAAVIDAILADWNVSGQQVAADVGAGTGIGARLLADRGLRVMAIEPNAEMRSVAPPHPGVEFIAGIAEQIPLATASVDLVTSFQAFHWFNFTQSLQEFQRVLKPGGRLALIWNLWDQTAPVTREYSRLIFAACREQRKPEMQFSTLFKSLRYQLFWRGWWLPYFKDLRCQEFQFHQVLDLPGLIGLARSQGFTPATGPAFEQMAADLVTFHQRFSNAEGQVRLTYCTRLYSATSADR